MKKLLVAFPEERIAFEIRLCASKKALQRHWTNIEGAGGGVEAFACGEALENGWKLARLWFSETPSPSLFAHEAMHGAEYMWGFVRRRKSAKGQNGAEFRAIMAATMTSLFNEWDKKVDTSFEATGIWEGL